jgi:hypothetical protein
VFKENPMRSRFLCCALVVLCYLLASPLRADTLVDATIPIFGQKIGFKHPQGWKPATQQPNSDVFLLELIPATEDINNWTQMLSVEGYRGMAARQTAAAAAGVELDSVSKACPATAVRTPLNLSNPQGYQSFVVIAGCGKHPEIKDRNEVALYNFIKGRTEIYMIKKSFREPLGDPKALHLGAGNYKELAGEVLAVQLCKNDGQGPNCTPEGPAFGVRPPVR